KFNYIRRCPAANLTGSQGFDYSMLRLKVYNPNNTRGFDLKDIRHPSSTILILDTDGAFDYLLTNGGSIQNALNAAPRHLNTVDALFCDYHTEIIGVQQLNAKWNNVYTNPN